MEQSTSVGPVTSSITPKLRPDTTYMFVVAAVNGANGVGSRSNTMETKTNFGGMYSE